MKNILSENMLRFGVKNLSESNKKRLTLESILQTIQEHGLTEEVKDFLNEQQSTEVYGVIPFSGGMGSGTSVMSSFGGVWNFDPGSPARWVSSQTAGRCIATPMGPGSNVLTLNFIDLGFKLEYDCARQADGGNGFASARQNDFIYDANKFIKCLDAVNQPSYKNSNNKEQYAKEMASNWNKGVWSSGFKGAFKIIGAKRAFKTVCP